MSAALSHVDTRDAWERVDVRVRQACAIFDLMAQHSDLDNNVSYVSSAGRELMTKAIEDLQLLRADVFGAND